MKRTEKVQTTHEITRVLAVTCDLCGKAAKNPGSPWEEGWHERNEVEVSVDVRVRAEAGTVYPEGGDTRAVEYDICPECFHDKLVPWLTSQGAKAREVEREF